MREECQTVYSRSRRDAEQVGKMNTINVAGDNQLFTDICNNINIYIYISKRVVIAIKHNIRYLTYLVSIDG